MRLRGADARRRRARVKARRRQLELPDAARVMKKPRRWRNEIRVSNSSPSGNHGKGTGHQGTREHVGVPGGKGSHEDRNQGGGAIHLQGEGRFRTHGELSGQGAPARTFRRLSSGLEESVRAFEVRRKDAGVRAKLVTKHSALSIQHSAKSRMGS